MAAKYDLVVVGTGTAAMSAATRVRKAGWRVAVIDFRPFGGTCALRGCDPKKVLLAGAEAVDLARRMQPNGVRGELGIEWPALMAFKRGFTDPVPARSEANYAASGIDALHGRARFTGPGSLEVDGRAIEGRHFLLAAGAEPVKLGIPGEEHVITSEDFLDLNVLPRRLLFVGGGYIAAEFSHLAARAGAKVTILQRGPRMLAHFDPDLVEVLMETFRDAGIEVRTRTKVDSVAKSASGFSVRASSEGHSLEFEADLVVHAAGRKPDLEALNPGAAQIALKDGELELNQFLQSVSNPAVYAAGDTAQKGPPLTPVASLEGKVVADNLLNGNHRAPDYAGVPSVAFSLPPIAAVGLSEAQARKQGLRFRTNHKRASDWYTARRVGEAVYAFKVLVEENTERILGAHLVGPHADEVINLFALAIRNHLTAGDVKKTVFAYPSASSDISYLV